MWAIMPVMFIFGLSYEHSFQDWYVATLGKRGSFPLVKQEPGGGEKDLYITVYMRRVFFPFV